jgi:hypothetical protein
MKTPTNWVVCQKCLECAATALDMTGLPDVDYFECYACGHIWAAAKNSPLAAPEPCEPNWTSR